MLRRMSKTTIASFSTFFTALAVTAAVSEAPAAPPRDRQETQTAECARFEHMRHTFASCTSDMITLNEITARGDMPACLITIFDGASPTPTARTILALASGQTQIVEREAFKDKSMADIRVCMLENARKQSLGPHR